MASSTPQAKADCKVAIRAAHKSALAGCLHLFRQMLTKVQRPMRRDDTHPAFKVLRQLSMPECQSGSQLQHGVSSRQLHRASKCIARKRKEKKRKEKKRKEKKRKEKKRKEKKRKEKKRKEKKRKEKSTPFGVNSMRSRVVYRAAQASALLNGFGMSLSCSQVCHPLFLIMRC